MDQYFGMKMTFLLAWIFLEYLVLYPVTGQTTIATSPVLGCTTHTCSSIGCGTAADISSPCRCDYACQFFRDCCMDFVEHCGSLGDNGVVNSFDRAVHQLDRSQVSCVSLPHDGGNYWMISSCPKDWPYDQTRSRCEEYQSADIDINVIPASNGNTLTYKNVYCALCNGLSQNDLSPWILGFQCPADVTYKVRTGDIKLSELLHHDECTSSIEPPVNASFSVARQCLGSNLTDSCPTGTDSAIADLCARYQGFVVDEEGNTYRNPYCKLCNDVQGIGFAHSQDALRDICLQVDVTTRVPPDMLRPAKPTPRRPWQSVTPSPGTVNGTGDRGIGGNGLQPLSIVMDFSRESRVQVVQSEDVIKEVEISCQSGEVFDPFSQECLTLSCAKGYELRGNDCQRLEPPLNLTCGNGDSDLTVMLSVTVVLSDEMVSKCVTNGVVRNITWYIESTWSLPANTLKYSEDAKHPTNGGGINVMSRHNIENCINTTNNSLELYFTINSTILSYAKLEDLVDRSLLQKEPSSINSEYGLVAFAISQQCVSISGLDGCPNGLTVLSDAEVVSVNNSIFVRDNADNLYHSYETVFLASYKRDDRDFSTGFNKTFIVQVCDQRRVLSCSLITRPSTLFEPLEEFSGYLNNTITGEILGPEDYILTENGSIQYCTPDIFRQNATVNQTVSVGIFTYDQTQVILSFAGISISLVSLFVTFITYCIFPQMRRCDSNKLIMALCIVLLLAQLLQMVSGFGTSLRELCLSLSVLSHFLWTSVFALTSCLAFELNKTLGGRDSFTLSRENPRALLSYLTFTITISSILIGTCLAIHFTVGDQLRFSYGNDDVCWITDQRANLIAFGCPLGVFLIANIFLFLHTVTGIRNATKVRRSMMLESQSIKETAKELRVYLKISTLLGFTWSFGFVAGFAEINALWYVFIILNSLQGFYIFLAFTANKRVLGMWMNLFCKCTNSSNFNRSRSSRGTWTIPLSQRLSRLTSVTSLPRNSEYNTTNSERRYSGDRSTGSHRYSTTSHKVGSDRKIAGTGPKYSTDEYDGSPSGGRRYSHGEWKYAGERKHSGDRKYQTASDWRNSNGTKSIKK